MSKKLKLFTKAPIAHADNTLLHGSKIAGFEGLAHGPFQGGNFNFGSTSQ